MNNELYDLCKKVGFSKEEWEELVSGISCDKRIGRTHLEIFHKGKRGYQGKCLPKDILALLEFAKQNEVEMPVRQSASDYNNALLKNQDIKPFI
jgi:UDPglucose 6-dehydrogenase